jgi:hypothetical protein
VRPFMMVMDLGGIRDLADFLLCPRPQHCQTLFTVRSVIAFHVRMFVRPARWADGGFDADAPEEARRLPRGNRARLPLPTHLGSLSKVSRFGRPYCSRQGQRGIESGFGMIISVDLGGEQDGRARISKIPRIAQRDAHLE